MGVGGELRKFNFYRHILTHKQTHTYTHKSRCIIPKYYMLHCFVCGMACKDLFFKLQVKWNTSKSQLEKLQNIRIG